MAGDDIKHRNDTVLYKQNAFRYGQSLLVILCLLPVSVVYVNVHHCKIKVERQEQIRDKLDNMGERTKQKTDNLQPSPSASANGTWMDSNMLDRHTHRKDEENDKRDRDRERETHIQQWRWQRWRPLLLCSISTTTRAWYSEPDCNLRGCFS